MRQDYQIKRQREKDWEKLKQKKKKSSKLQSRHCQKHKIHNVDVQKLIKEHLQGNDISVDPQEYIETLQKELDDLKKALCAVEYTLPDQESEWYSEISDEDIYFNEHTTKIDKKQMLINLKKEQMDIDANN